MEVDGIWIDNIAPSKVRLFCHRSALFDGRPLEILRSHVSVAVF